MKLNVIFNYYSCGHLTLIIASSSENLAMSKMRLLHLGHRMYWYLSVESGIFTS